MPNETSMETMDAKAKEIEAMLKDAKAALNEYKGSEVNEIR